MHPWTFYAFEVTRDRQREADRSSLAAQARGARPAGPSRFRRGTAVALAKMTRGTAAAVDRLDCGVADDLRHSLAASE